MKLKINKYIWTIKIGDNKKLCEIESDNDPKQFYNGLCVYAEFEIWINKEVKPQRLMHTIMHELIHAYVYSFNSACSSECDYADFFAIYHKDLIADTKKITNYIGKALGYV